MAGMQLADSRKSPANHKRCFRSSKQVWIGAKCCEQMANSQRFELSSARDSLSKGLLSPKDTAKNWYYARRTYSQIHASARSDVPKKAGLTDEEIRFAKEQLHRCERNLGLSFVRNLCWSWRNGWRYVAG